MAYEYLIVPTDGRVPDPIQVSLTLRGGEGWRYVGNFPSANGTWIVMEREKRANR